MDDTGEANAAASIGRRSRRGPGVDAHGVARANSFVRARRRRPVGRPERPAACFLAFCLLVLVDLAGAAPLPNGVAAGDVTPTSVVLWARSDVAGTISFEYGTDESFDTVVGAVTADVSEPMQPVKVEIDGLTEMTSYVYRATDAAGDRSTGRFRTPATTGMNGLRFGVSGDWRGELNPYPSIANLPERDLDFFVALGDTIYADYPSVDVPQRQATTIEAFRRKHNEGYRTRFGLSSWIDARASTAVYAMIDDHEVTNDFAGGAPVGSDPRFDETGTMLNETQLFLNGLQAFQEYNPIRDEFYGPTGDVATEGKRKLYRFRTFGQDAAMLMLDARSFRDEPLDEGDFATTDAFLAATYDSSRTMLGDVQFADLTEDLITCRDLGITWKFILVPEPIQNLGPILAGDRFEGYAYERTRLLRFIEDNDIDNVAFIAADIHGTLVNNLVYRDAADGRVHTTDMFEITTGSVAFDAPFGPTVLGYVPELDAFFRQLGPTPQNDFVLVAGNVLLSVFNYPSIGLEPALIDARLVRGKYLSINTYGWTEFVIDAVTRCLTVTTYGVDWYSVEALTADPDAVIGRQPRVVSEFVVQPKLDRAAADAPPRCFSAPPLCGVFGAATLFALPLSLLTWKSGRHRTKRTQRHARG